MPGSSDLSPAVSASWRRRKLSLQACEVSATAGRTILDFYTLAEIDHPTATTTDLFPFWNESRQFLCPVNSF